MARALAVVAAGHAGVPDSALRESDAAGEFTSAGVGAEPRHGSDGQYDGDVLVVAAGDDLSFRRDLRRWATARASSRCASPSTDPSPATPNGSRCTGELRPVSPDAVPDHSCCPVSDGPARSDLLLTTADTRSTL